MNIPNRLTLSRIILTPVFLLVLILPFPHHMLLAALIFIGASITDAIDGNYARKHDLITDFGKFLDPIADKMLTTAAFLGFIYLGIGKGIVIITFLVLFREFVISSIRLAAAATGTVIAANRYGKFKTVMQMVAIITAMFFEYFKFLSARYFGNFLATFAGGAIETGMNVLVDLMLWAAAVLTVISGIIYVVQNKKCIDTNK